MGVTQAQYMQGSLNILVCKSYEAASLSGAASMYVATFICEEFCTYKVALIY